MNKYKKTFLIILVIIAVILIGITVVFNIVYPPKKIKALILSKLSYSINRKIDIKNVFVGFGGLTIKNLSISEKSVSEKVKFIEVQKIIIRPDILALFKGQIAANKISIMSPKINITRYKNGSFNFSDLIVDVPARQKTDTKKGAVLISFFISKFAITGGSIAFKDKKQQNLSANIKDINLALKGVSLISPFFLNLSMDALYQKMLAKISIKGSVDVKEEKISIKEIKVTMKGMDFKSTGFIDQFMSPDKLNYKFEFNLKSPDLNTLLLSTGMKMKGHVWGTMSASMKVKGKGIELSGINGNGFTRIDNLKVSQVKILDSLAAVSEMPQLRETSFKLLTSSVNIINGNIGLSNTRTYEGDKLDAYCSGRISLVSMTQDIKGEIKLTKKYSGGDLYRYTADSKGRATVPFIIQGSLGNPKVSLDLDKIAGTAMKNETKMIIKKEAEKLLKNFLRK